MSPREQPSAVRSVRSADSAHHVQTKVRWWAVALPLAAFVTLFCLIASPAAQAGERGGALPPVIGQVADVLPQMLLGLLG